MGTQFAWFYDAVVAALILIFIYIGGKRGFIRSVTMIIGYIISLILAFFISKTASPIIYENFIQDKVTSVIQTNIENIDVTGEIKNALGLDSMGINVSDEDINSIITESDGDLGDNIQKYISEKTGGIEISKDEINTKIQSIYRSNIVNSFINAMPSFMKDTVSQYFDQSDEALSSTIKALTSTKVGAAQFIEQNIVRGSIVTVIKMIIFILVFTFAMIIVRMLSRLFSGVNRIPIAGSVNAFLGAILGLLQGVAIIFIITMILHVVIALSNNEMIVFNSQTIQSTSLFKLFYNFKLLK